MKNLSIPKNFETIETIKAHSMVEAGYSVFAHDHLFHGESEPANPCHINRYVII